MKDPDDQSYPDLEENSLLGSPPSQVKEEILRDTAELHVPHDGDPWGRWKLWEIPSFYHGSLIGIALRPSELRELLTRINVAVTPTSDLGIYALFVRLARERGARGRLLHLALDEKYEEALESFMELTTEDQVLEAWSAAVATGDIPGPYWALLTHPATSHRAHRRAFLDLQNAAHRLLASKGAPIGWLQQLERELCEAREERYKLEEHHRQELAERDEQLAELEELLAQARAQGQPAPAITTGDGEVNRLKSRVANLEWRIVLESEWAKGAQEQSERLVHEIRAVQERLASLEQENERLKRREPAPPTDDAP